MQKRYGLSLVLFSLAGFLVPSGAAAGEADAAYKEMEETFGGIPSIMQVYPKSAVPAGWALIKETDLNPDTALSPRERELIGLGVAAQIPCQYCIYYHSKAAKAFGASEEQVREAVHMSSLVRHWSTVLQGNQYDLDAFKAETDAAFAGLETVPSAEETISSINEDWVQAFKDRDFEKLGAIMTDDSMVLAPGAPPILGRDSVVEAWKGWGELKNVKIDFGADKIVVAQSGDIAYDYGWYTFDFESDEGPESDKGKYIVVWHNVGGEWRVAVDIFNSNPKEE
ncbi:MAG: DUF4440 domain-containing protein [Kiloniellales bacterium]|nr:DUF4440 domain-containing protein [Kiloniellales bacterium]